MGLPPKHKNILIYITDTVAKLVLASLIIFFGIPCLFLVLYVLSSDSPREKYAEAKQNIGVFQRLQYSYITDNDIFAKTFDTLAMGTLQGGDSAESSQFQYKFYIQSKDLAVIGAKPKDGDKNGFNGAVLRYKNRKGFSSMRSITCESSTAGADGTAPQNLPVVNAAGKLACASSWKVIQEKNEEPSDRELVQIFENKVKDENERVLSEQDNIYYKHGKFAARYSNIPVDKNRELSKFNVKIKNLGDRAIVTVRLDSADRDKYKTFFGLIKVVRSKSAQPLTDTDRDDNTVFWHYLDTISFLCISDRAGAPLPNHKKLARVIDSCPTGYTKSKEREGVFDLVKHNLGTIRMRQEGYYEQHHQFMTNFAEFKEFAITNSRRYSSFIKVKQDRYQYNFRVNGKQLVITAQPKSFGDPSSSVTYLRISSATGTLQYWPHVYTHCESKTPNIPIPTDTEISRIGLSYNRGVDYLRSCPTGYSEVKIGVDSK